MSFTEVGEGSMESVERSGDELPSVDICSDIVAPLLTAIAARIDGKQWYMAQLNGCTGKICLTK